MNGFDRKCLDLAINEAELSFKAGNYPVGAVLACGESIIGRGLNTGETSKNYVNHAETRLIIDNGEVLLKNATASQTITLYSTLEPCLMCLGLAVMNKVNRIVYVQTDPHAGACGISRAGLGVRYQEVWPAIVQHDYSDRPKELIMAFLHDRIASGTRVEWSQKFLKLIEAV